MRAEFAKQGAIITEFGFSETMPYDIAVACMTMTSRKRSNSWETRLRSMAQ